MNQFQFSPATATRDAEELVSWYRARKRNLPWRINRDPYRIWVSEVMLQQTTVAAVIPFYERFLERFPKLEDLAAARVEEVVKLWSGLGYYSRARLLHRSAQALRQRGGFPKTWEELITLPGFGPYTARAVSSLAFDQKTGVLDGNVIRVLSRRHALDLEWWKPKGREALQAIADHLAQTDAPADLNQGLMELGATICTPQKPTCLLCPWFRRCKAHKEDRVLSLPRKKPKRERELWIWRPNLFERRGRIALLENSYAPFLRGQWIMPGRAERVSRPPRRFDFRHSITHHDIFVIASRARQPTQRDQKVQWVPRNELAEWAPTTLVQRAVVTASEK